MINETEEFESRVQAIVEDMKKGIPDTDIFIEYNLRWNMPLHITQGYVNAAKKAFQQSRAVSASITSGCNTKIERETTKHKPNYKLSEEQFLEILSKNKNSYATTAKAIRTKYKICFSRQAVRERALALKLQKN